MFTSLRKSVALPAVPIEPVAIGATVASFGWLLAQDLIDPLLVFLVQLYLAF